ncbi:MAG: hypothetical protein ACE367_16725 [Acidimicrobiales bacterium]
MHQPDPSTRADQHRDVGTWADAREAVHINDRVLRVDGRALEAYSRHIDDVLVAFIELVRGARRNDTEGSMRFRRMDIDAIAADLGTAPTRVIDHLAALIGADMDHLEEMCSSYEAGAAVIDSGVADVAVADDIDDEDEDAAALTH